MVEIRDCDVLHALMLAHYGLNFHGINVMYDKNLFKNVIYIKS